MNNKLSLDVKINKIMDNHQILINIQIKIFTRMLIQIQVYCKEI